MPRIRSVKPELFRHAKLFDAERESGLPLRVAFIGLFCSADREGRFKWRPRELKPDILPHDDLDFSLVLDALASAGFIVRYEVDGELYGHVVKFSKHQVINVREAQSVLPGPDDLFVRREDAKPPEPPPNNPTWPYPSGLPAVLAPEEHARTCMHVHAHGEQEQEGEQEGEGKLKALSPAEADDPENADTVAAIFGLWQTVMRKPRAVLDAKRRKLIGDALKLGYAPTDLCKAIRGCGGSAWHQGANDRRTPFNSLELILRNAEKIDAFMQLHDERARLASATAPPTLSEARRNTIQALTGNKPNDDKGENDGYTIDA